MSSIWTTDDPLSSSPAFLNESVAAESSSGELAVCVDGLVIKAWEPVTGLTVGDRVLRGSVYFAALLYLFLGVSIISDRFMQAIEVITSQEKKVSIRSRGEKKTVLVRVWNETVANLTLMALGSSAPEIMLSVIEIYAKNFVAGDLGPGTIVGSAAYNLFVIIALCVYVIPAGEVRKIKQIGVFFVTATWSVFAYIWLYLILSYFSPGVVEVWEGLLTFLFFPLTVLTAYLTDKKVPIHKLPLKLFKCKSHSAVGAAEAADMEMSNSDYEDFEDMLEHARQQSASLLKELRREYPDKSMGELKAIAQEKMEATGPKSRAFYRIQATRSITGSSITQRPRGDAQHDDRVEVVRIADDNVYVKFDEPEMTVLENVGAVVVKVVVDGPPPGLPLLVDYQSEDGSAQAGSDYMAVSGTLIFKPGQREQMFKVKIIDDDVFEEDEHFYVRLSNPRWQQSGKTNKALSSPVAAGGSTTAAAVMMTLNGGLPPPPKIPDDRGGTVKINILDDDHGGVFGFADDTLDVSESVGTFLATVERKTGARGVVRIPFFTENVTARAGKDYVDTAGSIVFENNEARKTIPVQIISENCYERNVSFKLHLGSPQTETGEIIRAQTQIGEKSAMDGLPILGEHPILTVNIRESLEFKDAVDNLVETRASPFIVGTSTWKEQFSSAIKVRSDDDDDGTPPSNVEYFFHFCSLPWKILFAFVPPTDMCYGYLTFTVSMFSIGVLTAVIGDVASHFGCTVCVHDAVTAITFVALGTSVPDTFASKVSAIQDATADNSVGNVTGSNAVNVFLGIGIAWSIAALYHAWHGRPFIVPPGNLAFSVTIFCTEALIAIVVIVARRTDSIGGELGGPTKPKIITSIFLFSLWIIYLLISTLEVYGVIEGF
ncbi:Sodium calcium exchanger [Nesidiocoris tenuis]|uniref:Sodium calcium exchanger n=1 Tax=Nesidiocoris tenuis TaxID=355587 RepID=A0ABN7AJP5_9HEMI|nr:Sodium calcium exchanger [Nesidiocoris tenuis]